MSPDEQLNILKDIWQKQKKVKNVMSKEDNETIKYYLNEVSIDIDIQYFTMHIHITSKKNLISNNYCICSLNSIIAPYLQGISSDFYNPFPEQVLENIKENRVEPNLLKK